MATPQIVRTGLSYKVDLGKRLRTLFETLGEPEIFMTWSVDLNSLAFKAASDEPRQAIHCSAWPTIVNGVASSSTLRKK